MNRLFEYTTNHPFLVAAAAILAVLTVVIEIRQRGRGSSQVAPNDAVRLINGGALVLDVRDAKDYLIGSFPLRLDTNRKVASFLAQVEYYQLGLDYPERYADLIGKVSREDVQRVAKQYMHPEKLITVVVGNLRMVGEAP